MPGVCAQSARSRHLIGRSLGGARKKLTGHGRYKIWHFKPSEGREAALPSTETNLTEKTHMGLGLDLASYIRARP